MYKIYKIESGGSDKFFMAYSRQDNDKRRYTLKRNARIGAKGKLYDWIRELLREEKEFFLNTVIGEEGPYNLKTVSECIEVIAKEEKIIKDILISKHKERILELIDDIEELEGCGGSTSSKKIIEDNKKEVKELEYKIKNLKS